MGFIGKGLFGDFVGGCVLIVCVYVFLFTVVCLIVFCVCLLFLLLFVCCVSCFCCLCFLRGFV